MFQKLITERRSIRKYTEQKVEQEKLKQILEAGRIAPTARNLQNLRFLVVEGEQVPKFAEYAKLNKPGFAEAPLIIGVAGTDLEPMRNGCAKRDVDASIATSFMMLQAHDLGLGTCWLGSYDQAGVKEYFALPAEEHVVALLVIGYAAEEPQMRPRKDLDELVVYKD